jgi:hypothetical protein
MSTGTLPATIDHTQRAIAVASAEIDPKILETVVVNGDLSKLDPKQRVLWYRARCEAAGLDPRTQPFMYLSLQGKLTLYATKTASDQLTGIHRISVEIRSREFDSTTGLAVVHCRATFPDGHFVEDCGALILGKLQGEALANATMKVVTKAKRRTVLSACGLGMLDESEVDSVPNARRISRDEIEAMVDQDGEVEAYPDRTAHHAINHDNQTGHGRTGAYLDAAGTNAYLKWVSDYTKRVNARWRKRWAEDFGPDDTRHLKWKEGDLLYISQLGLHLIKWAKAEGLLKAPDAPVAAQVDKFAAVIWSREPERVQEEAQAYVAEQNTKIRTKLLMPAMPRPKPLEPEDESQETQDADDVLDAAYGDVTDDAGPGDGPEDREA